MADPRTGAQRNAADVALVERCRFGDEAAKRELLGRVLPTMRAAITSLIGAGADADDALQQGAIDLLKGLATFRGESGLESWARTIAVRAGLRTVRQRRRHEAGADPEVLGLPARVAEESLRDRIPRPVQVYLEALPEAQREALVLRHALGYTVPEIAELLGSSVNTIKSRLLQARREIRRLIRRDSNLGTGGPR